MQNKANSEITKLIYEHKQLCNILPITPPLLAPVANLHHSNYATHPPFVTHNREILTTQ